MKITTRQKVLAYAIPVDLVIVATGVGLVVPAMQPLALIGLYVAAVGLSAWKSGWGGSLAAMVLSAVLLIVLFSRSMHGTAYEHAASMAPTSAERDFLRLGGRASR